MPRSCGANGNFQRGSAAYSSTGFNCAFKQRGIEEEEKRRRRIQHIDGRDAAVGEILFGKQHRRAVDIGGEAVRGQRLPIRENRELGVVLAAGLFQIGGQFAVEFLAALLESGYLASACRQHLSATVLPLRCQ